MNITCISTSNTKLRGKESNSTKVAHLIKDIVYKENDSYVTNIVPLMDYDIKPCILCGECSTNMKCKYDKDFNRLLDELFKSDKLFFIVPHYSPIPSKLIILLEKLNEIIYGGWLKDNNFKFPLSRKKVGIIGHGGMPENDEVLKYYHDSIVKPVARTLEGLSFKPIGVNDMYPNGVVFGLKDETCIKDKEGELFPDIIQDFEMIETRIKPLVIKVLKD